MHTPADIQTGSHKHTRLLDRYTDVHTLTQHEYVFSNIRKRVHSSHALMAPTVKHTDTFTHQALPVTDVGRNIARKKALSFLFILSVFWHAYLCTQCGHVTEAVSFLFQFLCARFFLPPPPFSHVIIVKLKSFVPREIRRESGKVMGTLAKIFLSVMS